MKCTPSRKAITVLSTTATRQWHSPFSKILREIHQANIVDECIDRVRDTGFLRYEIYDAYETRLAAGVIPEPIVE